MSKTQINKSTNKIKNTLYLSKELVRHSNQGVGLINVSLSATTKPFDILIDLFKNILTVCIAGYIASFGFPEALNNMSKIQVLLLIAITISIIFIVVTVYFRQRMTSAFLDNLTAKIKLDTTCQEILLASAVMLEDCAATEDAPDIKSKAVL